MTLTPEGNVTPVVDVVCKSCSAYLLTIADRVHLRIWNLKLKLSCSVNEILFSPWCFLSE